MKLLILLFLLVNTTPSVSADFRNSEWGMSKEQVKSTEKLELVNEDTDTISYIETVVEYPALLVYKFNDNRLIWGLYSFNQVNNNDDGYLEDFLKFENAISSKYGKGKVLDKWNNKDSENKDNPAKAVREGDFIMWRTWETPTTMIKLIMYGYNDKFNTDTYYFSKKYKDQAESNIKDILNDNF